MSVSRHLELVRVRCLCRRKSGTWPCGPCGRSGGECSTSWPRAPGLMAGKQAKQASVGNVRTMRDERAGGAVVGERIRRSRPHFTEGQTETPQLRFLAKRERGRDPRSRPRSWGISSAPSVRPRRWGKLFSPERRLNWAGTSPAPSLQLWCPQVNWDSRP